MASRWRHSSAVFFCFVFSMQLAGVGHAKESQHLCEDLAKFTAAPGTWEDVTGSARNPEHADSIAEEIRLQYRQPIQDAFRESLVASGSRDFAQTAVNALQLQCSPGCEQQIKSGKLEGELLNNVVIALSQHLLADLLSDLIPRSQNHRQYRIPSSEPQKIRESLDDDFLTEHSVYKKMHQRFHEEILDAFDVADLEQKIKTEIFPRVIAIYKEILDARIIDDDALSFVIDRLDNLGFKGVDCRHPGPGMPSKLSQTMANNAYYNAMTKSFEYCRGLLTLNTSLFDIVSTVAHEVFHAIDPCHIAIGPGEHRFEYKDLSADATTAENEYPIPNLISCLRDERSVHATRMVDYYKYRADKNTRDWDSGSESSVSDQDENENPLSTWEAAFSPFCNHNEPGDAVIVQDLIAEATADWGATEVLSRYAEKYFPDLSEEEFRKGYGNVLRGAFYQFEKAGTFSGAHFDPHPSSEDRINRILIVHPLVRKQMGCPPITDDRLYCGESSP